MLRCVCYWCVPCAVELQEKEVASREKKSGKEMASAAKLVTETVKRTAELDKQEDEVRALSWRGGAENVHVLQQVLTACLLVNRGGSATVYANALPLGPLAYLLIVEKLLSGRS